MNVVGPINSPSSKGHKFLLAMTDYFSKLVEAISLKEVKVENVVNFIRTNLVYLTPCFINKIECTSHVCQDLFIHTCDNNIVIQISVYYKSDYIFQTDQTV